MRISWQQDERAYFYKYFTQHHKGMRAGRYPFDSLKVQQGIGVQLWVSLWVLNWRNFYKTFKFNYLGSLCGGSTTHHIWKTGILTEAARFFMRDNNGRH